MKPGACRSVRGLRPVVSDRGDRSCSPALSLSFHICLIVLDELSWNKSLFPKMERYHHDHYASESCFFSIITAHDESGATQSWDQVGHPGHRRPRHPTQRPTQIQTEADPSVQEQASEEGSPGVSCEWCSLYVRSIRNNDKWWCLVFFSLQLWWRYPWNGGLRHRWVHLRFQIHLISLSILCRRLSSVTCLFLLQTSLSFAPGRPSITWSCMSWPSTASSEPSRISLQSPEDYRPCTSNHLPPAPCPSFKWNFLKQTTTVNCNKHKKWKKRKKNLFYPLLLDFSSGSAVYSWHLLMFRLRWFESHDFTRFAPSLYNSIRFSSLAMLLSSPFHFFSFLFFSRTKHETSNWV